MRRISGILLFLVGMALHVEGQFGNEWINANLQYYSFKIGKDDFYRITRDELSSAGIPVENILANRYQLFRRGEEMAINVQTETDGTIAYLEFFATRNDGVGDQPLYAADDQPHPFYNLFSDSAAYFLTYRLTSGDTKRMAFSADRNTTGLTPEPFHIADTIILRTTEYARGLKFGTGSALISATYTDGEGWTGPFRRKNQSTTFNFTLENWVASEEAVLEAVFVGGNSLDHNVRLDIGPSTSALTTLGNIGFSGWGSTRREFLFPLTQVDATGGFTVSVLTEGFAGVSDNVATSYMRVLYPQAIRYDGKNKLFEIPADLLDKYWIQIETDEPENLDIFDVTRLENQVRLAVSPFPADNRLDVIVPNTIGDHRVFAVGERANVGQIESVNFPTYSLDQKDYLIITHEDLLAGSNPVQAYADYRSSSSGGSNQVLITEVDDLYNLFNFGDPSSLALRNFIAYANSISAIENIFLIGKGYTPFSVLNQNTISPIRAFPDRVNVPTFGHPGSDQLFSLGLSNDPDLPAIPIGRLNVTQPDEVSAYLSKVQEMEALPYDDLFRKDFLQLSGGISQAEIRTFENIIDGFSQIVENDFIGGRTFNTGKQTSDAVEFINVEEQINQGVGYVTFFGHSSGAVTDIEIGRVSDPNLGFSNAGRYPIFLVNGCQAGEIFGENETFGEDWMITPNRGAVAFTAHSSFAIASALRNWSSIYHILGYATSDLLGISIGELLLRTGEEYVSQFTNSDASLTQVRQMVLQGDPSFILFGADSPDYATSSEDIFVSSITGTQQVIASQDSFKIDVVVRNFGRSVTDSLDVAVGRTLPDGSSRNYDFRFERVLRQDTLELFITNEPGDVVNGINLLTISLDPQNSVVELSEVNNTTSLEVPIFQGNTLNLFPQDFAVLSETMVDFIWQNSNNLSSTRSYDFQTDTDPSFASTNFRSALIEAEVLASYSFDYSSLGLADSSTVFWRTRLANPQSGESNEWVTSSFTLINGAASGWGQFTFEQFADNSITGLTFDPSSSTWDFTESANPIEIFTFGTNNEDFSEQDVSVSINGIDFTVTTNTFDPFCEANTFNAVAFDRETGDPYRPIVTNAIDVLNREVCGRLPQRIYQFREVDLIGANRRLKVLNDNMEEGDQIVLFSWDSVAYSQWDDDLYATLEQLGFNRSSFETLDDGQPVIALGIKGADPSTSIVISENGSSVPVKEQNIQLAEQVTGKFSSGSIVSSRVGPASDWNDLQFRLEEDASDVNRVAVVGISQDGSRTELFTRARIENIDIASVDPVLYPQLEILFTTGDPIDQSASQLDYWQVDFELAPEGLLLPATKDTFLLREGEEILREFWFYNLSQQDFSDSIAISGALINSVNGSRVEQVFRIAPPSSGDTTIFNLQFSSFGRDGDNSLVVDVAPVENEFYRENNRVTLSNAIQVTPDETNPVLDVTFDGFHILNGDIVSPTPMIAITLRDDNS
ncbi:MAG: C25 family cysteine peptidase, partial [Bacteroidota bacterium]